MGMKNTDVEQWYSGRDQYKMWQRAETTWEDLDQGAAWGNKGREWEFPVFQWY